MKELQFRDADKDGKPLIAYDEARRQPFLWDENDKVFNYLVSINSRNESVARYGAQKEDENSLIITMLI